MPNIKYSDLPVKDRMEWMKSYKKTYPDSSYYDMKNHFDSTSGDQIELQNDENPYSYNVDNNRSLVNQDNLNYDRYLGEIEKYGEGMTPNEYNAKYPTQQDFDRWNAKKIRTYNQTEFGNGGKLGSIIASDTYYPSRKGEYINSFDDYSKNINNSFNIDGKLAPMKQFKPFELTGGIGTQTTDKGSDLTGRIGLKLGTDFTNNTGQNNKQSVWNFKGTGIEAGVGIDGNKTYPYGEGKFQLNANLLNNKNSNINLNFVPANLHLGETPQTTGYSPGLGITAESKKYGLSGNIMGNYNIVESQPSINFGITKTFGYPNKRYKYNGVHDNERNLGQFAYGGSLEDGDPQGNQPNYNDSLQLYANSKKIEDYYKNYHFENRTPFTGNIDEDSKDDISRFNSHERHAQTKNGNIQLPMSAYYLQLPDKNKFMQRESALGILDTDAPMSLYDRRIQPQFNDGYTNIEQGNPLKGDLVVINQYDPLAVKPYKLLTESEKKQRIEKYGLTGFPKDYNQPKPQVTSNVSETGMTYNQTQTYRQSHPNANFNTNAQGLFVLAPQPQIKPIVKQEQPIPSVKEVVKQPVVPQQPKEIPYNGPTKYQTQSGAGQKYYFIRSADGKTSFPVEEEKYNNYYKGYKEVPLKKYGGKLNRFDNGGKTNPYKSINLDTQPVPYNPSETVNQAPNKYLMQEQIKQAGKSAVEGAAKSEFDAHNEKEQFWKDHPGHSEEERKAIQRKIDSPLLYNPAGTIASLATRASMMTPDEIEKTYANPIESLKWAGDRVGDALVNELAGAAVGKIVDLSQIPFKQLMGNAKNNLLDVGYGLANNPVSKAVTTPINNFRLGIKESMGKTSNMKHITETLSPEEFGKFREIQNLSAQSIDGGIPREKLIQNYLKSSLDDTQINKLTGKTRLELEEELKNPPEAKKASDPNTFDWAASDDNARRAYANRNAERTSNGNDLDVDNPPSYTGNEMSNGTIPSWLRIHMEGRSNINGTLNANINQMSEERLRSFIENTGDFT